MTLEFNQAGPTPAPLCKWFGGKSKTYAAKIAALLPEQHVNYVEPFGGMAGVLLSKKPSRVEVYNDLEGSIVNLFRVVRDPDQCARLVEMLELTPYSRAEQKYCYQNYQAEADPIEKARMVYSALSMAFVGRLSAGSGGFNFGGPAHDANPAAAHFRKLKNIKEVSARFASVIIENQPAEQLLTRWDNSQTLFYLDPPYLPEVRGPGSSKYIHELGTDQHLDLMAWCRQTPSMVVISGYPSALYTHELETLGGYTRLDFAAKAASQLKTVGNKLKEAPNSIQDRVESLWFNPRAWAARSSTSTAGTSPHQGAPARQAALW